MTPHGLLTPVRHHEKSWLYVYRDEPNRCSKRRDLEAQQSRDHRQISLEAGVSAYQGQERL